MDTYSAESDICFIDQYRIVEDEVNDYHPYFASGGVGTVQGDEVVFTSKTLMFETFEFQIKITAHGGYVYYTESQVFYSQCGPDSSGIIEAQLDTFFTYVLNGEMPYFEIPEF